MKSHFYHAQINVSDPAFYKELLSYLGFKTIVEFPEGIGMEDGNASLWIMNTPEKYKNRGFHRKGIGLNHFAFRVDTKEEVDKFHKEYLVAKNISVLYGGPKEYPEYELGYYAVYFED